MRTVTGSLCQLAGAWLEQQGGELGLRRDLGATGAICCPRCAAATGVHHSGKVTLSFHCFLLPKVTGQEQVVHCPTLGKALACASLAGRALYSKMHPINSITMALPKLLRILPGLLVPPGASQATVLTW